MFINTQTNEILTYSQLRQQPEFKGVGWPHDHTVSGIDDLIAANGYARFFETARPDVADGMIAEKGGAVFKDGQWQRDWILRKKKTEEIRAEIVSEIDRLEAQQTPRRIREAALTESGREWLENLSEQIAALREKLSSV